ncbi:hypothetical protein NBT05_09865 [Aquimarina sp. ERC-38]|uniref:hypothetical protein n=1 Tax=Aquimarina sp. ERC-38 TaxID=2949996 RepID=UPI0022450555|nr:hypothetical protein [Aquimarina sp. ERC-38]UZO79276.1 hypothetical protein NBT05_09865 [Aquimarina sp. ERC-38]
MNTLKKQHKLLSILCKQINPILVSSITNKPIDNYNYACSFDNLCKQLNCTEVELYALSSRLIEEKEISFYDVNFKGYIAHDKANSSLLSNKYLKEYYNILWNTIKNWIQTLIPVLSLIAVITIAQNKNYIEQDEVEKLKESVAYLSKNMKVIENNVLKLKDEKNSFIAKKDSIK